MYCPKCGHVNEDNARFCVECGSSLNAEANVPEPAPAPAPEPEPAPAPAPTPAPAPAPAQNTYQDQQYQQQTWENPQVAYAQAEPMSSTDQTLRLINFILCIISCVASCWFIVPLAWMVPMTVHSWGIYKGTKANTVAFGVCTLIFTNLIGGILLLVSKKDA